MGQQGCAGFALAVAILFQAAHAANTPCSGRKGGVDYCLNGQFVCNDGSISASKQICSAPAPSAPRHLLPKQAASSHDCSCRSGNLYNGPRGGQYCLSDNGRKSYVRR